VLLLVVHRSRLRRLLAASIVTTRQTTWGCGQPHPLMLDGKQQSWHVVTMHGKYDLAAEPVLFVQLVRSLSLREALDWSEDYLDRPDEQPTKSLPEVITRILSRASDAPHTVTASKPAGAVDVMSGQPKTCASRSSAARTVITGTGEIEEQALLPLDRASRPTSSRETSRPR